jgi:hypothetical protein
LVVNPGAVLALFHDTGLVDQEDTFVLAKRCADQPLMLRNDRLHRPGALTDEVLQGANGHPQMQRHRFNRFAFAVAEQTTEVDLGPTGLVTTRKGRGEVRMIGCKSIGQAPHIARCQIAFGHRAGIEYNVHGYGFLFGSLCGCPTKDTIPSLC